MSAQDIAILAEINQGQLAPITFELLGGAKELAQAGGGSVIVYLLGEALQEHESALSGADKVIEVDHPQLAQFTPQTYIQALEQLVNQDRPRALLIGSTSMGLDIASLLAARLNAPIACSCQDIKVEGDTLHVVSQLYSGKIQADVNITASPAILLVLPACFHEFEGAGSAEIEKREVSLPAEPGAIVFEEMILPEAGDVDITQQDILVSIGRGIEQQENIEMAEELAEALGGAVSASRPIVDQGWLPSTRQVGKSGMIVSPKCYLALGISGAPEHQEGMRGANLIIAVNTDPNAPIFNIAHYGAVADMLDVVEALKEQLAAKKG
ncbi:electron transfer flavoprotein subunit alpha/FixB family protein [bacterium]|nr:electron transfer flavoprotein subunit alpha/FixB family protein [bacterium]